MCELLSLLSGVERSIKHVELEIEQRLHPEEERLVRMEKITGRSFDQCGAGAASFSLYPSSACRRLPLETSYNSSVS